MSQKQHSVFHTNNSKQPILSDTYCSALHRESINHPAQDILASSVRNVSDALRGQMANHEKNLFAASSCSSIETQNAPLLDSASSSRSGKNKLQTHSSELHHPVHPVCDSPVPDPNGKPQTLDSPLRSPLRSVRDSAALHPNGKQQTLDSPLRSPLRPVRDSAALHPNGKPQTLDSPLRSPLRPVRDSAALHPNGKPQTLDSPLRSPLRPVRDSAALHPNGKPQTLDSPLRSPLRPVRDSAALHPNGKPQTLDSALRSPLRPVRLGAVLKRQTAKTAESLFGNRQSSEDSATGEQAATLLCTKSIQVGQSFLKKEIIKNTALSSLLHSGTSSFAKHHPKHSFTSRFTPRTASERLKAKIFHTKHHACYAYNTGQRIFFSLKKLFSNPAVVTVSAVLCFGVILFILFFSVISALVGTVSGFSLKADSQILSDTYLYITQLDAELENRILTADTAPHIPPIDVYRYFHNGTEVAKENISVITNADLLLAYLDSKYRDYTFAQAKNEIDTIHSVLYHLTPVHWTEEQIHEVPTLDPVTGEIVMIPQTQLIQHLDIYFVSSSWDDYYTQNKDFLLNPEQQQQYDALKEIGVYTFSQELSSPFPNIDWSKGVSSRWGWRIHPIYNSLEQHLGLDIAMPANTPVSACHSGTIVTGNDPNGWGNYIKIIQPNGDYTLYGHMLGFAVQNGQTVSAGDVIGFVGSTGASTGNHLHLEYHKQGKNLNPLIFTECEIP